MAILNIQPRMCSNGPVEVQTYILLRLWQDLEIVVHGRSSSISLTELELFSKEEWLREPTLQVQSWWRQTPTDSQL